MGPKPNSPTASSEDARNTSRSTWKQGFETFLAFAVFACLNAVTWTTPRLTNYGIYNSIQRTVYTTVVTLVATIITAAVVDGIRSLYLYRVDDQLVLYPRSSVLHRKRLDQRWQTILGIASISAKVRNLPIVIVLLLGALITTCITSGFTATSTTRTEKYTPKIPSADPYIFARPWDNGTQPNWGLMSWRLANGSLYAAWVFHGGSPQHRAFKLMDGININDQLCMPIQTPALRSCHLPSAHRLRSTIRNITDMASEKVWANTNGMLMPFPHAFP